METISLCMIVQNEEETLGQCLDSVKDICDEIIVVDTGSTDNTKEIALAAGAKVFDFEWIDDFSAARQYSFDQATKDYILWLDADDVLLEKDRDKLKALKRSLKPAVDAVSMLYHIEFDEDGKPTITYRRTQLVNRDRGFRWISPVHEYLEVGGNIIYSDVAVAHREKEKSLTTIQSDRKLEIYEKRMENGEAFSPRDLFYYANELKDHRKFAKSAMYYREFLATRKGWVEDEIRACINLSYCYECLEDPRRAMEALVMAMQYDVPRPEVSCKLGDIYKAQNKLDKAVFWYRSALEVEVNDTQGFVQESFSTWYPHLYLCYCYWQLGEKELSVKHNAEAKKYKPNSPQVLYNESFFKEQGLV